MDPYGFRTRMKPSRTGKIPSSVFDLGKRALQSELRAIRFGRNKKSVDISRPKSKTRKLRTKLEKLSLTNELVWERETQREKVQTSEVLYACYYGICTALDVVFLDKPIQRFWFLETIARMPYFSYVSILHLYETLGLWSVDSHLRIMHLKEDVNEARHLAVMEELGGGQMWYERFLAYHTSIFYFAALLPLYLFNPRLAYNSSELLEMHAVDTYDQFVHENEQTLKQLPPPLTAMRWESTPSNLYDVFSQISADEMKHARNMKALIK